MVQGSSLLRCAMGGCEKGANVPLAVPNGPHWDGHPVVLPAKPIVDLRELAAVAEEPGFQRLGLPHTGRFARSLDRI